MKCLAGMAIVAAVASGGTYTGVALTSSTPSAYTCPAGVYGQSCDYLKDIADAGLAVPSDALDVSQIICYNLKYDHTWHGLSEEPFTVEDQAKLFVTTHPAMSLNQAETYVSITQVDICNETAGGIRG